MYIITITGAAAEAGRGYVPAVEADARPHGRLRYD